MGALPPPNTASILFAKVGRVEEPEKTDDCMSVADLRGVAGAAPRKATGDDREVLREVCLLRYSVIFGDDSGFEFANYQEVLTREIIVVRAVLT